MDLGIAGKVALVAGGGMEVGQATARRLAREGCRVVVAAAEQTAIDATLKAIAAEGGTAAGVLANPLRQEDMRRAVKLACESFGPPEIAIDCVPSPGPGDFFDVKPEQYEQTFRDITLSLVYLCQAVIPHMQKCQWGRIVSVGSLSAKEPPGDLPHVLTSTVRASTATLVKSLANEFGPSGITVNSIGTGYIATERLYAYMDQMAKEKGLTRDALIAHATKDIPARRPGTVEEMAAMIGFLCSAGAGYVTGNMIAVDGGYHRSAW